MSGTLAGIQRSMARYLRDPLGADPPQGIETRRLEIYRDLVYRNIEGFISSGFPVLRTLYDDAAWEHRVRDFIRNHRCATPLFLRISEEFIAYLVALPEGRLRPFEAELAHYEWLELAVDVSEGEPAAPAREDLSPRQVRASLAPTVRLASYRFPVHRVGAAFQPLEAGDGSHLLVYRARTGRTEFMELNGATARLLYEFGEAGRLSVAEVLLTLAEQWGMDPDSLASFGWQQLREFNEAGIVVLTAESP